MARYSIKDVEKSVEVKRDSLDPEDILDTVLKRAKTHADLATGVSITQQYSGKKVKGGFTRKTRKVTYDPNYEDF